MYQLSDTIVAVSSPTYDKRVIVRLSGRGTIGILEEVFSPLASDRGGLMRGRVAVDEELSVEAVVYLFAGPRSYTGDDVGEIHFYGNRAVTEALIGKLLSSSGVAVRMAGPGEFTARAYLNGKIDLAQAEAVNEIIVSSNRFQLAAAEKLLSGRLAEATASIESELVNCLSLIEAGLDFSEQDIEFISRADAVDKVTGIRNHLEQLLSTSIVCEELVELPAVGIAGAPNAGKSSLLNRLLGKPRSIVSEKVKTTRDVLTGQLTLAHCRCVLFDCAGLIRQPVGILDELAQQAAIEAIRNAGVVLFCIDISKADFGEDMALCGLAEGEVVIPVATKTDLADEQIVAESLGRIGDIFEVEAVATSAKTGAGIERLREVIDERMVERFVAGGTSETAEMKYGVALTARHKQAVGEAIENIDESMGELAVGNDEVAAMLLRAACQAVSTIEQHQIDEQILERIFERFCIGK